MATSELYWTRKTTTGIARHKRAIYAVLFYVGTLVAPVVLLAIFNLIETL